MPDTEVPMKKTTKLRIGAHDWVKVLREMTAPIGRDYWRGFTPASANEMTKLERETGRKLPLEFVEFYRTIGYGEFPDRIGGGFYAPDAIIERLGAPIYYVRGSLFQGAEWCTAEEHRRLWTTRAAFNPAPARFTQRALTLRGVGLYDLLWFGSDGCCCYHQLYVGPPPAPFGYCLLSDCQKIEARRPTFSTGVETIVRRDLKYNRLWED